jgi:Triose-phosphate Transporter family
LVDILQATTPVAVLLTTWGLGVAPPNLKTLGNVSFIVIGVMIATYGEIAFVLTGFLYQAGGIVFEAIRLTLVERLLSSAEFKMDPLVSLYYFAPVCAIMNGIASLIVEVPVMQMSDIYKVGPLVFIANAMVAFLLNVSVVFLVCWLYLSCIEGAPDRLQIGKTSSLVLTLCGVLKDIMLVAASMLIWGTPVSALQFFGYGIALSGMLYYKLGAEQLKGYASQLGRSWSEFGVQRPAMRKVAVFFAILMTIFIILGGLAPTFAPETTQTLKDIVNGGRLGT